MTSPSTLNRLARKAEASGQRKKAKTLRAKAAEMRREARGALTNDPADALTKEAKRARLAQEKRWAAEKEVQDRIDAAVNAAVERERHKVSCEMSVAEAERAKAVHDIHHIQVVSAFIAEIEALQRVSHGTLPPTVTISGFTISRIYTALRDAGFTRDGKGGVNRETIRKAVPQLALMAAAREGYKKD